MTVVIVAILATSDSTAPEPEGGPDIASNHTGHGTIPSGMSIREVQAPAEKTPDIVMPTKVSRPGCEADGTCYVPQAFTAMPGYPVTWINEDSAFHSVTSGTYDMPGNLFDSGHMNPYQRYALVFDDVGEYDYYCTLHPWMAGTVLVVER